MVIDINEQDVDGLVMSTFSITVGAAPAVQAPVVPGDMTGDGKVDLMDVIRLWKFLNDVGVPADGANCDITGDMTINREDVIRLQQYIADPTVEIH